MKLAIRAIRNALISIVLLGLLVFLPAGTISYWQGWTFILVFTVSTMIIGLYLTLKDPALLARRMKAGPLAETRHVQKILISFALLGFIALPIFAAFDHRFGWSSVPVWLALIGNFLVALGLMMDLRVFQENSFAASTVEKMSNQRLISSGPYAWVRHPMYSGLLVMLLGVPLALGSYWGLLITLINIPILMLRSIDEEAMLRAELEGYDLYMKTVPHRLVPGLW